jgi:hypothetical protein
MRARGRRLRKTRPERDNLFVLYSYTPVRSHLSYTRIIQLHHSGLWRENMYIIITHIYLRIILYIRTCGGGGTANTSSATSREKSHCIYVYIYILYIHARVCVCAYMRVLRFDYIVIECVCDVLDIIIVVIICHHRVFRCSASAEKCINRRRPQQRRSAENSHRQISRDRPQYVRTVHLYVHGY